MIQRQVVGPFALHAFGVRAIPGAINQQDMAVIRVYDVHLRQPIPERFPIGLGIEQSYGEVSAIRMRREKFECRLRKTVGKHAPFHGEKVLTIRYLEKHHVLEQPA